METKHNETATAHEWDEMRAQWAALNRKLSNEPLDDDRHIRESMGKRTDWIGDKVHLDRAFAPLISAALIGFYYVNIISLGLLIFTLVVATLSSIIDHRIYIAKYRTLFDKDLITVSHELLRIKKMQQAEFFWNLIILLIFIVWFGYDTSSHQATRSFNDWMPWIFGGAVSVFYAWRRHKKVQRTNDDLLRQIKELTEGETSQHASTDNL